MGRLRENLKAIVEDRKANSGLTQKRLAGMMGAKPAMVSALLSGHRGLSDAWIERFCAALNITLGDLEEPSSRIYEPRELRDYYGKLKELYLTSPLLAFRSASRLIDDWIEAARSSPAPQSPAPLEITRRDSAPQPVRKVRIPHYGTVPADPRHVIPEGQVWFETCRSDYQQSWYTLRVTGDSMSPDYLDGDTVMIDYAREPKHGDVVAALIDDYESTLKVYSLKADEITLTPIETKRHSPRTFHASRIEIQGVLVEIVRRAPPQRRSLRRRE